MVVWEYEFPDELGIDLLKRTIRRYPLVEAGLFKKYVEQVNESVSRNEFAVVVGPKGIGKSVLTIYALAKLLNANARVVYELDLDDDVDLIDRLDREVRGKNAVVFYDTSSYTYYEPEAVEVPNVRKSKGVARKLIWTYRWLKDRGVAVPFIIVLSDDVYNAIKSHIEKEAREERVEVHLIQVDLRDVEFLASVVNAYSGGACGEGARAAGELIAERYGDYYTLIARYAGAWLNHAGCADVERAVRVGATTAKAYALLYVYVNIFGESSDVARKLLRGGEVGDLCMADTEKEFVMSWLRQRGGMLGEVIEELAAGRLSNELRAVYKEARKLGVDLFDVDAVEAAKRLEESIKRAG